MDMATGFWASPMPKTTSWAKPLDRPEEQEHAETNFADPELFITTCSFQKLFHFKIFKYLIIGY